MRARHRTFVGLFGALFGLFTAAQEANAITTSQYPANLAAFTITAAAPLIDSVLGAGPPFGDADVLSYVRSGEGIFTGWGVTLNLVSGAGALSNCPSAQCTQFGGSGDNGATYTGPAASVFAIHWGGGGQVQPLLGLQFATAITFLEISGFDKGVSFIRGYSVPNPVPLPGALWLMGTVVAGWMGIVRWRRKGPVLSS
jgi:hypothetical protein